MVRGIDFEQQGDLGGIWSTFKGSVESMHWTDAGLQMEWDLPYH